MGVTIGTNRIEISMGYGSFSRFRRGVAKAFSQEFGEAYNSYIDKSLRIYISGTEEELKKLDKKFNDYLKTVDIDNDIVDFLFQPDCEGKIGYKTAGKIRDLCRISKSDEYFGYDRDRRSMSEMAEIFNDAYKHRCQVKWC